MSEIIEPKVNIQLVVALPSSPAGSTNLVPPLPPGPPVNWSPLVQGLNSGEVTVSFTGVATDREGNWVAVQENGFAAYSEDRGETWLPLIQGLNSGSVSADFNAVETDRVGNWVAVADGGFAARGTEV